MAATDSSSERPRVARVITSTRCALESYEADDLPCHGAEV